MAQHRDNAYNRHVTYFYDQWGREWDVTLDKKTMAPDSAPIPKFTAPLIPPAKYVDVGRRIGTLSVNCDRWLNDLDDRTREWDVIFQKLVEDMEPNRMVQALEQPTATLLKYAGVKPLPREFVLAMKAGNSWVLGKTDVEPAWLTPALKDALRVQQQTPSRLVTAAELAFYADPELSEAEQELIDPDTIAFADAPPPPKRRGRAA